MKLTDKHYYNQEFKENFRFTMEALLYGGQKRFLNDVVLKVATLLVL